MPINHKNKKLGWINKKYKGFLKSMSLNTDKIEAQDLFIKLKKKSKFANIKIKNDEICPVFNFSSLEPKIDFCDNEPFGINNIFKIDRKLLSILGLPQYGIHGNAWSLKKNRVIFHFAKRSQKLDDFPGFYDNLFAGGQPLGISILDNLKKEAFEEAGIKEILKKNLVRGSTVNYFHEYQDKIHSGIIFNYHYEIENNDFINIDGEVESFISEDAFEIYKLLESKTLKPNCIIPIADFFLRNMNDLFPKKGILELEKLLKNEQRT